MKRFRIIGRLYLTLGTAIGAALVLMLSLINPMTAAATPLKSVMYYALSIPNDPLWPLQWNMERMRVDTAWDTAAPSAAAGGDARVVVAVLDSGVASTMVGSAASVPDFIPSHVWTNTGEIPGDGLDNDHDGYIDDVHGWNFVSNTNSPADDNGHGTHIVNTIAAGTNNGIATASIAGNVTIMPLKVLDHRGVGSTAALTSAVRYAIAQHVQIINLSLGSNEDDPTFHRAVQDAVAQGIIVVGAAGNKGTSPVTYPAAYDEVISVGATNTDDTRAAYSNFGSALDVVAPGGNTSVDLNHDGQPDGVPAQMCLDGSCTSFDTIYVAGTSQAAAEVSGVAALLESCGAQPGMIQSILQQTAVDLGSPGRDDIFGFGLVDAAAALQSSGCVRVVPPSPTNVIVTSNARSAVPLPANGVYTYAQPKFMWGGPAGATYAITWRKGSRIIAQTQQTATTYIPRVTTAATYRLTVSALNGLGQASDPVDVLYSYQPRSLLLTAGATVRMLNPNLTTAKNLAAPFRTSGIIVSGAMIGANPQPRVFVAGQPQGAGLAMLDTRGKVLSIVTPFGKKFAGTMSAASVTAADGEQQVVVGTASVGGTVAWLTPGLRALQQNLVFPKYTGGVSLAVGDINGDGDDEVVVAQVAGPSIAVYNYQHQKIATFTPRGATYKQGWNVAVGDLDGDGVAEIIAVPRLAGSTTKALVLNASGRSRSTLSLVGVGANLTFIATDLTGDGRAELITVPQRGAGTLRVVSANGSVVRQLSLNSTIFRSLSSL